MDLEREQLIQDIAEEVLGLEAHEQLRYLDGLMVKDPILVQEVRELLGNAIEVKRSEKELHQDLRIGQQLGSFRLLRLLGSGGMGKVYLAEQTGAIERKVAVKLIGHELHDPEVLQRFKIEQQMLANLSHPNVANLYETGITDDGTPYFAMEYIDGEDIFSYCKQHQLSIHERLQLLLQVCDAITHAHFKGVIHRDLKPSNILVYQNNGRPTAKVIDFGISKSTMQSLRLTRSGSQLGSLPYMSPEQAGKVDTYGNVMDIDIRSDVYSLGVLLYQLLTGVLPIHWEEGCSFKQMLQDICEKEPIKPSARMAQMPLGEIERHAEQCQATLLSIVHQLKFDLDWVAMRALQKDREQRYRSVSQLSDDLKAYLAGFPVSAGPPSLAYTVKKFLARHKLQASILALVILSLILIPFSYSFATWRQQAQTLKEKDRAELVIKLMVDLFRTADPQARGGHQLTAKEMIDKGYRDVEDKLVEQPEVRARMLVTLGKIYNNLGHYEEAHELAKKGFELRQEMPDISMEEITSARILLAETLDSKGQFQAAEQLLTQALSYSLEELGPDHILTLKGQYLLVKILHSQSQLKEADKLLVDVVAGYEKKLPQNFNDYSRAKLLEAIISLRTGKFSKAERAAEVVLETLEGRPDANPIIMLDAYLIRGIVESNFVSHETAEVTFKHALGIGLRHLGPEHHKTLGAMQNVAMALQGQKKFAEATAVLQRVIQTMSQLELSNQVVIAGMYMALGHMASRTGQLEQAVDYFEDALAIYQKQFPNQPHVQIAYAYNAMAMLKLELNQLDEAEIYVREALRQKLILFDEDHDGIAATRLWLSEIKVAKGEFEEAMAQKEFALACVSESKINGERISVQVGYVESNVAMAKGDLQNAQLCLQQLYIQVKDKTCDLEAYEGKALRLLAQIQDGERSIHSELNYRDLNVEWQLDRLEKIDYWQQESQKFLLQGDLLY
jgi:serine/threonine protein kinase